MQPARRSALRASRSLSRQSKRKYSDQPGGHSDHQHTVDKAHPVEHANKTEHFGSRFFLALTAIPVCAIAYDYSKSDANNPPALTTYLESFRDMDKEWARRNDLHQRAVKQAADDRLLFSTAGRTQMIELKAPDTMNNASPWNNVAGHRADLTELMAHYQKKNQEMDELIANKTQEQRDKYL